MTNKEKEDAEYAKRVKEQLGEFLDSYPDEAFLFGGLCDLVEETIPDENLNVAVALKEVVMSAINTFYGYMDFLSEESSEEEDKNLKPWGMDTCPDCGEEETMLYGPAEEVGGKEGEENKPKEDTG